MIRFLHTADVQLVAPMPEDSHELRARREARFTALQRAIALARQEQVDFIAICGDLFEDNQVSNEAVHRALHILQDVAPLPVFILPGNHDPFCSGSVYRRPAFTPDQLKNVRVLSTRDPVAFNEQCTLYPCPVVRKTSTLDPTAGIPPRQRPEEIRIGLAHGSLRIESKHDNQDHPIPLEVCQNRDLDYLALGHWHSFYQHGYGRIAYPGTPEQTSFSETEAGQVLIVSISGPKAVPEIQRQPTGTLSWQEWHRDVSEPVSDTLAALRQQVEALAERDKVLLRLQLDGAVRADSLPLLDDFEDWLGAAGLLRAEMVNRVKSLEQTEGALRILVESDEVIAGVVADLQKLAALDAGGVDESNQEVPPRSAEELLKTWKECRTVSGEAEADRFLKDVQSTEAAQGALLLLARLAEEV